MTNNVWVRQTAYDQDPNHLIHNAIGPRVPLAQSNIVVIFEFILRMLFSDLHGRGAFGVCTGCLLVCRYFWGGSVAERGYSTGLDCSICT